MKTSKLLDTVVHEYVTALTFWGWEGDRDVVGNYVKTNDDDKNVMPTSW
jgi:hypothetical protein